VTSTAQLKVLQERDLSRDDCVALGITMEARLRRVAGHRHLLKLREALKRELKIETESMERRSAE